METIEIKLPDDSMRDLYVYDSVKEPKGVILIIHGMQEHAMRYTHVIQIFNDNNYIVFAYNQRGHGQNAFDTHTMGQGKKDIFEECVLDAECICKYIKSAYPNIPLYVYGHSFGSFVTQRLMQICNLPAKWVLSGTTSGDAMLYKLAYVVAKLSAIKGKQKPATLIEKMSFDSYKKHFTDKNWLSRDPNVQKRFDEDELCGVPFPVSFYISLFSHLKRLNKGIKNIKKDTKVLLVAGTDDPVGNYAKGPSKLHSLYLKAGLDSHLKLYDKGRHELHNELNSQEVLNNVIDFYNLK